MLRCEEIHAERWWLKAKIVDDEGRPNALWLVFKCVVNCGFLNGDVRRRIGGGLEMKGAAYTDEEMLWVVGFGYRSKMVMGGLA